MPVNNNNIVVSDYMYITPETKKYWDELSEEKKKYYIEEAEYFSEEYSGGEPISFTDVQTGLLFGF